MIKITVRKKIKLERIQRDIKLKEVGQTLGVDPQLIAYIEKKDDTSTMIKYLNFLRKKGVDLNTLFNL